MKVPRYEQNLAAHMIMSKLPSKFWCLSSLYHFNKSIRPCDTFCDLWRTVEYRKLASNSIVMKGFNLNWHTWYSTFIRTWTPISPATVPRKNLYLGSELSEAARMAGIWTSVAERTSFKPDIGQRQRSAGSK